MSRDSHPVRATVLLVEDDERLRRAVGRNLQSAGFVVREAGTGASALEQLRSGDVDVVVLDVGLPDIDGFEVCAAIRQQVGSVPVLMLTARGEIDARVAGLDAGADDYMVKPFAIRELAARLRALLRRTSVGELLVVGTLRVAPAERRAWQHDEELHLSRREFDLLELLVREPGVVLERSTILDQVWPDTDMPASNVVDQYVRRLRAKITPTEDGHPIVTVRAVGYRLQRPRPGGTP